MDPPEQTNDATGSFETETLPASQSIPPLLLLAFVLPAFIAG
jgi:hypothetical protein